MKRIIELWSRIDAVMQEFEYYDDDLQQTVCELTEEEIYNSVVEKDDLKFLGTEKVKKEIHKFLTDDKYRFSILNKYSLF